MKYTHRSDKEWAWSLVVFGVLSAIAALVMCWTARADPASRWRICQSSRKFRTREPEPAMKCNVAHEMWRARNDALVAGTLQIVPGGPSAILLPLDTHQLLSVNVGRIGAVAQLGGQQAAMGWTQPAAVPPPLNQQSFNATSTLIDMDGVVSQQ